MSLKPQDIFILLKLVSLDTEDWSYASLADSLQLGVAEVHRGLKRARAAQLVGVDKKHANTAALFEFIAHGIKYWLPAERGTITRGIPTCHGATFVQEAFTQGSEIVPVWPYPEGRVRGESYEPIYRSVPEAALKDEVLYRLLVLVDLIRGGSTRESSWAIDELAKALKVEV